MKIVYRLKKNYSYVFIILLTVLYLVFLSDNCSSDSYSNAYSSLYAQDMFKPHHLLYCLFGHIVLLLFGFTAVEPITLLQITNALFAGGCLLVARRMIKRVNRNETFLSFAILACGTCFGFARFAIDNECYIIPVFFNLLALYYMQVFLVKNTVSRLVKASVSIVAACLFHQIAVLVWICLFVVLIANKNGKYLLVFLSISMIVPLAYWIASYGVTGSANVSSLMGFVLHDYLDGTAQMPQLKQVVVLTLASLFRTFFQMHGYVFEIARLNPLAFTIICLVVIGLVVLGMIRFAKAKKRSLILFHDRRFVRLLWLVLVFNIAFAAFSNGNAEFMVMIPFVAILIFSYCYTNQSVLLYLSCAMLIWNVPFGLYPYAFTRMHCNERTADLMRLHPEAVYVLMEKPYVENIYLYKYSDEDMPLMYNAHKYDSVMFKEHKAQGREVITDVIGAESPLSRASMVTEIKFRFDGIKKEKIFFRFHFLGIKRELSLL